MRTWLRFGPTALPLIVNWARQAQVPGHANAIVLRPTRDAKLEVLYVVPTQRVTGTIERIAPLFTEVHTVLPVVYHKLRHEYGLRLYMRELTVEGWTVWATRGLGPDLIAVKGKMVMAVEYSHGGFAERGEVRLSKLDRPAYRIARRAGMATRHVRYIPGVRGRPGSAATFQLRDQEGAK